MSVPYPVMEALAYDPRRLMGAGMPGQKIAAAVQERAGRQNQENIRGLVEQLRSPLGVIPFVGAGFSAPFGFPQWDALLLELAADLSRENRGKVSAAVKREEYMGAATIVAEGLGEFDFQSAIAASFPDEALARVDLAEAAVAFVPLLSSGLVITTNFDGALEYVFKRTGYEPRLVYGANPNEIVPAIQRNRLTLWKIHGDRNDPRTRVLSAEDYQTHYVRLRGLLALAFANRPALFLGCSLVQDRTVAVLTNQQKQWPGLKHFALLQCPADEKKFDSRVTKLRRLGIRPIWYPEGEHGEIRHRLSEIVQQASMSRSAVRASATTTDKIGPHNAKAARTVLEREIRDLTRPGLGSAADEPPENAMPYPALLDRLIRGELAFFLGAGAALGRLPLARAFYETLRSLIQAPDELGDERVTQHFADRYGRGALDAKVHEMLGGPTPEPTALHWLLATLTSRLRDKGYRPRPPLILTTNFDDWMERALLVAGEPYHLFTFRVEEPHAGHFVYRSPSGEVFVVDRPEQFHEVPGEHAIVVKYHGGLHHDISLPVTYAFTRGDSIQATRRLPAALPRAVVDRLTGSSLLFLGHGLADDSVEALARELHRRNPSVRSWAIQRLARPGWPLYWREIGVDIVDIWLSRFVLKMHKQLEELPAVGSHLMKEHGLSRNGATAIDRRLIRHHLLACHLS